MEIMLCFGVFCHVMLFFSNKQVINNQGVLVSRIVCCIDPYNTILKTKNEFDCDEEIKKINPEMDGHNSSEISRILSGERLLKLEKPDAFSISKSKELFKKFISTWFNNEAKISMILVLRDIIEKELYIGEHEFIFEEFFGMSKQEFLRQDEYNFYDLMFCALRYTMLGNAGTEKEKSIVKQVNDSIVKNSKNKKGKYNTGEENGFFRFLTSYAENVKNVADLAKIGYIWNQETLTLKKTSRSVLKISNEVLHKESEPQTNELEDFNIKALIDRQSFDTIPSYCIEDAIHLYGRIKNNTLREDTKYDTFADKLLEFLKYLKSNCADPENFKNGFSLKSDHENDFEMKVSGFTRELNDLYSQIEKDFQSEIDNQNEDLREKAKMPPQDSDKL